MTALEGKRNQQQKSRPKLCHMPYISCASNSAQNIWKGGRWGEERAWNFTWEDEKSSRE
jgi:hypothetical protein